MKANKILLILLAASMYLSHIPLYIAAFAIFFQDLFQFEGDLATPLFFTSLGAMGVTLVIATLITVFSIISIFKGKESPSKVTMIVKCALIPWFVLNFALCVCILGGMMNPFLLWGIPAMMAIMVCATYINMLASSLPDIAWFIRLLIKKKIKISPMLIVSIVFLFIFCLDIAGGIMYYIGTKEVKTIE